MSEAKKSDSTDQLGLAAQDLTGDVAWLWTHCRALGMTRRSLSGLMRDDVALFVANLHAASRHPTLAECEAAGRGPENYPGKPFEVGGLPATKEERARFEAYMRGHAWDVGHYVSADECYDTTFVRCLFGVWRDRGALPTVWPNA